MEDAEEKSMNFDRDGELDVLCFLALTASNFGEKREEFEIGGQPEDL